jgi:hypothetical protein
LVFNNVLDDETNSLYLVVSESIIDGRSVEILVVCNVSLIVFEGNAFTFLDFVFIKQWELFAKPIIPLIVKQELHGPGIERQN